jgi:hypothetical protein
MGLMDWLRGQPARPGESSGLAEQIEYLLSAPPDIAFLVIAINDSGDDFVQFATNEQSVLVDFPLITKRQQQRETRIHAACASLGLEPSVTIGPNDARYLNCNAPRDAQVLTNVARVLLKEVYGVIDESKLAFQTHDS